jgi:exodeoxyribonuclease VII large subunit
VTGEIVDLTQPSSGHLYFGLRDPGGVVRCVMFRAQAQFLRFPPQNGLQVEAQGIVSIYAPQGHIQLAVDVLAPAGRGALLAALEALKTRLAAEGLFAPERKRPLPRWPRTVGIVTSASGAALQDLLRVIRTRAPWMRIVIAPARVQGEGAAGDLARAIERLNRHGQAEVVIVGRGGGALEDLWAFNSEAVVRAVAGSRIPIVSAVGHETDVTLADLAADHRAATPSHAAEQVVPDRAAARDRIVHAAHRLGLALTNRHRMRAERFARLPMRLPRGLVARHIRARATVEELSSRLRRAATRLTPLKLAELAGLEGRLLALGPAEVLRRGYALVRSPAGQVISQAQGLVPADRLRLDFRDGHVFTTVESVALETNWGPHFAQSQKPGSGPGSGRGCGPVAETPGSTP